MKGAIATIDFYVVHEADRVDRLSLVVAAPERSPSGEGWQCRVAMPNRYPAELIAGRDSFEVLCLAIDRARTWVGALHAEGRVLTRDRAGTIPFELPYEWPVESS